MSELAELIEEQEKDDVRVVRGDRHSFPVDPHKLAYLADSRQKVASHKISWGEPAEIFECKRDRRCPRCGRRKNEKNLEPFDISNDPPSNVDWDYDVDGSHYGARCPEETVSSHYTKIQDFTF